MAQLAKIETKKIRISKEHLLREKELLLSDLDKQDSRKQMIYTFLIFLFLGCLLLEDVGRNLAMAMITLAFVGVSIYKNPEVIDGVEAHEYPSVYDSLPLISVSIG